MREIAVIGTYMVKMFPAGCFGVLFCAATLPLRRRRLSRNNMGTSAAHELCLMLFTAFLAGLFALIVQSSGKSSGGLHDNLIPFQIIADLASELHAGIWMGFWVSFPGNIVMFLPLGFCPALLWHRITFRIALLIGACTSLTTELCQLPLGRSTDIDDLWLNTSGTAIGHGLYRTLDGRRPRWTKACKVIYKTEEETSHGCKTGD